MAGICAFGMVMVCFFLFSREYRQEKKGLLPFALWAGLWSLCLTLVYFSVRFFYPLVF